ncbi:MAG: hypothetical protein Hals2KO_33350 [Halioglobus sp.]
MSDSGGPVELWNAPYFEQTTPANAQADPAERESVAQALGFKAGRDEGFAAGKQEAERIVAALTSVADSMAQPYKDLDEIVTRELVSMAMQLAEQIARRELSIDAHIVEGLVEEALATLYKLEGEIVIFLNPSDAKLIEEFSPESLEGRNWKVVEDPNLQPGGCQVKTPTSFVDASVEKRIETVFASVIEAFEQGTDD